MLSFKKRILAFLVTLIIVIGVIPTASGCKSVESKVEFWSTYNTVKVNKDRHDYDQVKMPASIDITMAQGEYESAQIIFTPEKDVNKYNVTVTDLINTVTGEVYSKDRIRVYKQEYVFLASIFETIDGGVPGYYPDALIPMDAVVRYKENAVRAGDNQGINFRFSTRPELDKNGYAIVKDETKTRDAERFSYVSPGAYTGTATFDIDGTITNIPISLLIVDAVVSETNHVKSDYVAQGSALSASLNYTQEGLDEYTDTMLEYRICNVELYNDFMVGDAKIPDTTKIIVERLKNPRYSNYTMKAENRKYEYNFGTEAEVASGSKAFTKESYLALFDADNEYYIRSFYNQSKAIEYRDKYVFKDADGNEYAYDESLKGQPAGGMTFMQHQIWYLLKYSMQDGVSYLDKCQYEFNQIDEPWQHNTHEGVRSCLTLFKAAIIQLAQKIDTEDKPSMTINGETITLDFSISKLDRETIVDSVLNFKCLVSGEYLETFEGIVEKWCPTTRFYASEQERVNCYSDQKEKWWYTVNEAPYMGFATEVSPLYGRVGGWIMADYGIQGVMNWGGAVFGASIDEYFRTNTLRYANHNGEGYFIYPGGQYGLNEAIPSIRLEALRDGLEEYELLYNIKNLYSDVSKKIGVEFDGSKIIKNLGSSIYSENKILNDSYVFAQARNSLLQLSSCAESAANMCIVDYVDDGYGSFEFQIYMNDGITLYNNGTEVTDIIKKIDGGNIYKVTVGLTNDSNLLDLSFTVDGIEYKYRQILGGKVSIYEVGYFKASDFEKSTEIAFSSTEVDCITEGIYSSIGGKAIKIIAGESKESKDENKSQYFKFYCESLKSCFAGAKSITIHLYNASDEDINLRLEYKKVGSGVLRTLTTATIEKGKEISLTIALPKLSETDYIDYIDFGVGEGSAADTAKVLYIRDIVVYE